MADMLPITIEDEIVSVKREIGMRERNYPGWVRTGRLKLDRAEYEIAVMHAVLVRLMKIKDGDA